MPELLAEYPIIPFRSIEISLSGSGWRFLKSSVWAILRSVIVYLNGRFVPAEQAVVSIMDRGFLYGDGLFETLRLYEGRPFLWDDHLARFNQGCAALRLVPPLSPGEMLKVVRFLAERNGLLDATVRLSLSRGVGARGYSPRGANDPTLAVAAFPLAGELPAGYRVITASPRLVSGDFLAGFKHSNKLRQILARAEADEAGADEAILLNERGDVGEGTTSNLFWIEGEVLSTPPLNEGILAGTTRAYVMRIAARAGFEIREERASVDRVKQAEGIFLTSTGLEVMEISHWDEVPVRRSEKVARIKDLYRGHLALQS